MATTEVLAGAVKSFQDDGKGKKDEATSLEPKDFFWDQFLKYISSAILALTVLNVSVEFLRGGGVQCFPPLVYNFLNDAEVDDIERDFTLRQADYLNNYCSDSIPSSEFFPIYVLVQGLLLIAPHFIWGAVFKGDFDSFYAVTEKLDRLRDRNTGMYDSTNFDRVEKLEIEFGSKRKRIFLCYIFKLLLQLAVCVGTVTFSEVYFTDFSFTFKCPTGIENGMDFPENWPLNTTIPCVFASLRVLSLIRYGDYILTGMAAVLIIVGLIWCAIRHTKELGHIGIAQFVFQSCLTTKTHVFPPIYKVHSKRNPSDRCWFCSFPFALFCPCCRGCMVCSFRFMLFTPRIHNDLDFLQMTLFRADSSHGRVFKEIQIDKELQKLHGKDHQLIHLFLNVQLDMNALINKRKRDGDDTDAASAQQQALPREVDLHDFFRMSGFSGNPEKYAFTHYQSLLGNTKWSPVEGIRDRLYGFVKFCPLHVKGDKIGEVKTDMAMDISFGSSGYALVLARAFQTVVSVNFRPFFRNQSEPVKKEKFYTNYVNVDFPENIFTRSSDTISEAVQQMVEPMFEDKQRPVDFIVVGPFEEDEKKITVTLAIEMLYSCKIIEQEAILLAVRPLKIGHRTMTQRFLKYEPPVQLFDHSFHETTVLPLLHEEVGPDFREVDEYTGITVKCGDTDCIFEFIAYKYIGEAAADQEDENGQPEIVTLADLMGPSNDEPIQPSNVGVGSQHPAGIGRSLSVPLTVGGVHDLGGVSNRPMQLQRQNTVDKSARERSLRQQRSTSSRLTRSASRPAPNNEFSDSNRRQYTLESAASTPEAGVSSVRHLHSTNGSRQQRVTQRPSGSSRSPLSSIDEGRGSDVNDLESPLISPTPVFEHDRDQ